MVLQLYGCLACGVHSMFDADEQKEHYKSEWHRYNLRRKINGLPSVPLNAFEEKLAAASGAAQQAARLLAETFHCLACSKQFGSKNSYENHLKSLKHVQNEELSKIKEISPKNVRTSDEDEEEPDEADDGASEASWETLSDENLTEDELETWSPSCFFCSWPKAAGINREPKKTPTIDGLLAHLAREHSFVLPQADYVRELKSLLCHLSCRVVILCQCLWCDMQFATTRSAQQHMIDKGHTKLRHEMPESERPQRRRYHSESSFSEEDEEPEVPRHFKYYNFRGHVPAGPVLDDDGWSLLLPRGTTAGHRDLQRYYKQHLRAVPQGFHCPANVARLGFASSEEKRRTVLSVVMHHQQSKQLLLHGGTRAAHLTPLSKANQRRNMNAHSKRQLRLGMTNNRLMHTYRSQQGIGGP